MTRDALDSLRSRKYIGVAELANEAARLIIATGTVQQRGTVREVPDERTLRYYITEGLISPASEKQGTASVYGYLHLLQLLVVKNLQAQHLPIRKIRELVEGRSEKELEKMLGIEEGRASRPDKTASKNAALGYLETLLKEPRSVAPPAASIAPPSPPSPSPPTSLSPPSPPSSSMTRGAPAVAPPASSAPAGTWERVELEPGLELHIHSGYQPPSGARGLRRLTQLITSAVETLTQRWSGSKGSGQQ